MWNEAHNSDFKVGLKIQNILHKRLKEQSQHWEMNSAFYVLFSITLIDIEKGGLQIDVEN